MSLTNHDFTGESASNHSSVLEIHCTLASNDGFLPLHGHNDLMLSLAPLLMVLGIFVLHPHSKIVHPVECLQYSLT